MDEKRVKEAAEAERRRIERRNNASLDFGVADRRKGDRRDGAARG